MNPGLEYVPEELKALPNWVQWKLETKDGRQTKIPFIAGTDRHASSTNPSTWTTFDVVKDATISSTQGIGFVLGGQAVTEKIIGVDLDGCRDPKTGDLTDWANQIVDALDSYTEVTPSETGVRVWVKGELPSGEGLVFNLDPSAGFGQKVKIEIYATERYFTVTGDAFEGPEKVETRDLTKAYELFRDVKAKHPVKKQTTTENPGTASQVVKVRTPGVITTDLALLMGGKITSASPFVVEDEYGNSNSYPSHSEADLSLCTHLAFVHETAEAIDTEFRESPLYRGKWERDGYRESTIARAMQTAGKINTQLSAATATVATEEILPFVAVDGDSFMLEEIRPRKVLIRTSDKNEPVFFEQSINQIFAWRGLGKTCLGLGLTGAFAKGEKFLNWEAPQRARVLYIEGELPESQFQERWKQIIGKTNGYARLVTIDKQPDHAFPSFATQEGMRRVEATLARLESEGFKTEVLILDSISTLFNINANDEEGWIAIQSWLISLRSRGLCIFFFHHAGKSGMSRSHSKSEDMLDVSIKLDFPKEKEEGCLHAVLTYDKARAGLNEPSSEIKMRRVHSAACLCKRATGGLIIGCRGDQVKWEFGFSIDVKKATAQRMFADGVTVKAVSRELKVPEGTVNTWRTRWAAERAALVDS